MTLAEGSGLLAGRSGALLPLPLLAAAAALAVAGPGGVTAGQVAPVIGLSVLAALGLGAAAMSGRRGLPARVALYLGLLVLMAVLVSRSPYFTLVSWLLFFQAFALFDTRWAFLLGGGAAVLLAVVRADAPSSGGSPLFVLGLVLPLLCAGWFLGRESDARRRLAAALAASNRELSAALAANTTLRDRLLARAHEAAVRGERQRMAREIHDTLAQGLSATVAQLEVALAGGDRWRDRVVLARDLARDGLVEARRSVRALSPTPLERASLAEALRRLTDEWQDRTGAPVCCDLDPEATAVPAAVATVLFRAAQSALANVAEHAAASRVRLTLSYLDDEVALDVRDDGVGFDPAAVATGTGGRGFGLAGMRCRLAEVGGALAVESAPAAGTAIRASVPLRGNA